MTDNLKTMYNSEALLEEVDNRIKSSPVTIIFTFSQSTGLYQCNYTYAEIKKMLDDNLPITDVISNDSTGVFHGGHITRTGSDTTLKIVFTSSFTATSQYFNAVQFFGYTFASNDTIVKYVPQS